MAAWSGTHCCYQDIRVYKPIDRRHAPITPLEGTRSVGVCPASSAFPLLEHFHASACAVGECLAPKVGFLSTRLRLCPVSLTVGPPGKLEVSNVQETVKDPQVFVHGLERGNSRQRHASLDKADSSLPSILSSTHAASIGRHMRKPRHHAMALAWVRAREPPPGRPRHRPSRGASVDNGSGRLALSWPPGGSTDPGASGHLVAEMSGALHARHPFPHAQGHSGDGGSHERDSQSPLRLP